MKLGIQVICLDDEDYISQMLESLVPLDPAYVVLVDGGSTDKTTSLVDGYRKIFKLYAAKNTWENNFALQRNVAYRISPKGVDWWMRLDTDEMLPYNFIHIKELLDLLPPDALAARVRQMNLYPDKAHHVANLGGWETHPRIFRGDTAGAWVGQVHESFALMTRNGLKPFPELKIYSLAVDVLHSGWLSSQRREQRERLYMKMPGSGIEGLGDLTERRYVIKPLPPGTWR